uniref:Uncharacterized protein n=1 Tax=Octopus bimaculoides TaxID=37653 RepID=A0A0L8HRX4_OCTBM
MATLIVAEGVLPMEEEGVRKGVPKGKPSFAQAVGGDSIEIKMSKESLYTYRKYVQKVDGETKLIPPPEAVNAIKEKNVVYKVFNIKEKKIAEARNELVELCLAPIWSKVIHVNRGTRSATIEVHFESAEVAKEVSTETLKTDLIMLLPTYMGKRTARVTVEDIPFRYDVMWAAAA